MDARQVVQRISSVVRNGDVAHTVAQHKDPGGRFSMAIYHNHWNPVYTIIGVEYLGPNLYPKVVVDKEVATKAAVVRNIEAMSDRDLEWTFDDTLPGEG